MSGFDDIDVVVAAELRGGIDKLPVPPRGTLPRRSAPQGRIGLPLLLGGVVALVLFGIVVRLERGAMRDDGNAAGTFVKVQLDASIGPAFLQSSPDGNWVAAVSTDGHELRISRLDSRGRLTVAGTTQVFVASFVWLADSSGLAAAVSFDPSLPPRDQITRLPDSFEFVLISTDGAITRTGQATSVDLSGVATSPDGRLVTVTPACCVQPLRVLDRTGALMRTIDAGTPLRVLGWLDKAELAYSDGRSILRVQIGTGETTAIPIDVGNDVSGIRVLGRSPDATAIALGLGSGFGQPRTAERLVLLSATGLTPLPDFTGLWSGPSEALARVGDQLRGVSGSATRTFAAAAPLPSAVVWRAISGGIVVWQETSGGSLHAIALESAAHSDIPSASVVTVWPLQAGTFLVHRNDGVFLLLVAH